MPANMQASLREKAGMSRHDVPPGQMESVSDPCLELPTRQKNILRNLLDQSSITPADVASLSYRVVERAPGVGKQSLEIICKWLQRYGFELSGTPDQVSKGRAARRRYKIDRAIDYLRAHGYEVRRLR